MSVTTKSIPALVARQLAAETVFILQACRLSRLPSDAANDLESECKRCTTAERQRRMAWIRGAGLDHLDYVDSLCDQGEARPDPSRVLVWLYAEGIYGTRVSRRTGKPQRSPMSPRMIVYDGGAYAEPE